MNSMDVFRRSCPSAKAVKVRRGVAFTAFGLCAPGFVVEVLWRDGLAGWLGEPPAIVALVSFLLVLVLFLISMQLTWMRDDKCEELATACEAHLPLARYRDRVVAARRRFTYGEYLAMREFAFWRASRLFNAAMKAHDEADARSRRRRLYGDMQF